MSDQWIDMVPGVRRRPTAGVQSMYQMMVEFTAGATTPEHSHVHEQVTYLVCLADAATAAATDSGDRLASSTRYRFGSAPARSRNAYRTRSWKLTDSLSSRSASPRRSTRRPGRRKSNRQ